MLKPILIVEDNPKDLELSLIALERTQLANEVISVRDGAEALDYLRCQGTFADRACGNPAVVLLDLKLPKVDGLQVLKTIREDEQLSSIPVVMLTSSREEQDVLRSYQLGVNAFVVKPVEFKAFLEAIADLGVFWAVLNEPPPGSVRPRRSEVAVPRPGNGDGQAVGGAGSGGSTR
jgi:CheY-like chemotaxis protein